MCIVIAITQKPTQVKPEYTNPAAAATTEEDLKELKEKLDALKKVPKAKFNLPMTTSQEMGWDMDTEMKMHANPGTKNRRMCAETQYAQNYVTMTHKNPFHQRDKVPIPGAAGQK